jgi:hypothetical protein
MLTGARRRDGRHTPRKKAGRRPLFALPEIKISRRTKFLPAGCYAVGVTILKALQRLNPGAASLTPAPLDIPRNDDARREKCAKRQ